MPCAVFLVLIVAVAAVVVGLTPAILSVGSVHVVFKAGLADADFTFTVGEAFLNDAITFFAETQA